MIYNCLGNLPKISVFRVVLSEMTASFGCGVEGAEIIPGKESWREKEQTLGQLGQRVWPLQEGPVALPRKADSQRRNWQPRQVNREDTGCSQDWAHVRDSPCRHQRAEDPGKGGWVGA